jgi:ABC-2 type transport system permease protein
MLFRIARHEIQQLLRDRRLHAAGWLGGALLAALVLLGWQTYRRELHERAQFEREARHQWEHQGEKHPHRAAHFGFYVTKPELPLAVLDSGIKPATGQVLWLEAHTRTAFVHSPLEDAGAAAILGLTNGAEVLQLLGALLVVLAGYAIVAREREEATLRLVLAQGVSPLRWFAGKCLGLGLAFATVAVPVGAGLFALCVAAHPAGFSADVAVRTGFLALAYGVYFVTWLVGTVAVSAWARSARLALTLLLAAWIGGGVLAPRLASTLASALSPVPTVAKFRAAQAKDFNDGFDGEPGWDTWLAQLEKETLAKHGVSRLADLPVGFSGLRLQLMDEFTNRISDRHQVRLEEIYARQTRWHLLTALLGPFVPMRGVSQNLSGMDWTHYRDFAETAEQYRRGVVSSLDSLLGDRLRGDKWEVHFDHEVWSRVPQFSYTVPDAGWALRQAAWSWFCLVAWAAAVVGAAMVGARRIKP